MQLPPNTKDEIAVVSAKAVDSSELRKARGTDYPPSGVGSDAVWREFEFPGVLANVAEYRDMVMEFVGEHCPDEGDQIDILVAVQEALANAALHGCKDDPAKMIRCTVSASDADIVISMRDPGPGFDLAVADPENYQLTTLTHGRGICLMRSLMSDVSFAHKGSEIVLRKRLHHGK
jgi:serine/threonine-protein kinase RsbW